MFRIALAVVVGVVVTAVLFQLGAIVFLLVTVGMPLGADVTAPSGGGYAVLLLMAALAAVVGGRAARGVARHRAEVAAVGLSVAAALLAFWGFRQPASQWPTWWSPAVALSVGAGAALGGLFGASGRYRHHRR